MTKLPRLIQRRIDAEIIRKRKVDYLKMLRFNANGIDMRFWNYM